jgi:hypothetical protein
MNRPSSPETVWLKLCGHGWLAPYSIVSFLGLGGWKVSDRFLKAAVVEAIDPFERGKLPRFKVAPRSPSMDNFGLVKTVDRFGESVVVPVANASNGRLDVRLRQSFGIANGHVLRAAVGMTNQPAAMNGLPILAATDDTTAHCEGCSASCSATIRTARARTSEENLFVVLLVMNPTSRELGPPENPGRFTSFVVEQYKI